MAVKITIDRDKCVGAAACVAIAPEAFELDDQDKAIVIDPAGAPIEDIQEAADRCPTQAITVSEE